MQPVRILGRNRRYYEGRTIIQEHMLWLARERGLPTVTRTRVRRAPILTPERLEALVAGVILIGSLGYIGYHLVRAIVTKAFQVYG